MMPVRIGHYRITSQIGQGGMGVVYAAHDDRLDRPVAIKLIRPERLANETARERFKREARAAARVSHPNICVLYEFDVEDGRPFLVMELLEGEPLSVRLARGPMAIAEAVPLAISMLDALAALHRRAVVHRDLKPGNVFLTPSGPKLLDFGVAHAATATGELPLTMQGKLVGTPQYMAPEQVFGRTADERSDIFSAGAVLYEMLAGRPAFTGATLAEIVHAVGYANPAPLALGPEAGTLEAVIRHALEKNPGARPPRADAFATEIQSAVTRSPSLAAAAIPRRVTRFVALPLRILRSDPETDFLAFSVPEAVSAALAGLDSIIVRSPQSAGNTHRDVRAIARDLTVDVVLAGTILRAGSDVRVSAQLADADGTMIWSDVTQAPISDLFQLQDSLTSRIVTALAVPLSPRDRRALEAQAPANADAYELYMRANELMTQSSQWQQAERTLYDRAQEARTLYERAVHLDPTYAPAWARLGRARRVIAKYGGPAGIGMLLQAESAFRRALEIDPDLAMAHDYSAYVDVELGRAVDAMERLLKRAAVHSRDAGLFSGLVTTCRYAGLLDASIAADTVARVIDPAIETSVAWSHFFLGDREAAKRTDKDSPPFCRMLARYADRELSSDVFREFEAATPAGSVGMRLAMRAYRLVSEGNINAAIETIATLRGAGFSDPEGWYLYAFMFAKQQAHAPALTLLTRSVDGGFGCHRALTTDEVWSSFRGSHAFELLLKRAEAMVTTARNRFNAANGPRVLGLSSAQAPIVNAPTRTITLVATPPSD